MIFLGLGGKSPQKQASSALERAEKRKAAMHQNHQMPPPPPGELFMEEAECAKTGKSYVIIWHRNSEAERFTVQNVIKTADVTIKDIGADAAQDYETAETSCSYPCSAFVHCGDECPWCGSRAGLVYCGCSKKLCKGGLYTRGDEQRFSHAICGCDTGMSPNPRTHSQGHKEEPMLQMDGRAALDKPEKRQQQARIGRDKRAAIGHDKTPRLSNK